MIGMPAFYVNIVLLTCSFEAGTANAVSSFKRQKIFNFFANVHLPN